MIGLRFGTRFTLFHCEHDEKLDESRPTSSSLCNRPEVEWQYQQSLSSLPGIAGNVQPAVTANPQLGSILATTCRKLTARWERANAVEVFRWQSMRRWLP